MYPVAYSVRGNGSPDKWHLSALSAQMTLLNHRFATPWTSGIGLPPVSSVPREGKRTKETSFRTNEVAINFLPATGSREFCASFPRRALCARRRKIFRQLSVARFPINDLLGRSSYIIGAKLIGSELVRYRFLGR